MKNKTEKLLSLLMGTWVILKINDISPTYRAYVSRDYSLERWMLSFTNRNNYYFQPKAVQAIDFHLGSGITILTLYDDPSFGKGE